MGLFPLLFYSIFVSLSFWLVLIHRRLLEMDTADWLRLFEGSGVPVGPINSIQEVFSSPQVSELRPALCPGNYSARRRGYIHVGKELRPALEIVQLLPGKK